MAETEKYDPFAPPKDHVTEMRAMREKAGAVTPVEGVPETKSDEMVVHPPTEVEVPPAMPDLWVHRSQKMRCATCMWWLPKLPDTQGVKIVLGRCRNRSPSAGGWPATYAEDWCGDHKLDENKL